MQTITVTRLQKIKQNRDIEKNLLLDVRSKPEYEIEHIPGAICIAKTELQYKISELQQFENIYVYSYHDKRSHHACEILESLGMQNVYNIIGGIAQRKQSIDLIERKKRMSSHQQILILMSVLGLIFLLLGVFIHRLFFFVTVVIFVFLFYAGIYEDISSRFVALLPRNYAQVIYEKYHFTSMDGTIHVQQFTHPQRKVFSYVLRSDNQMIIVDPIKSILPYLDFAKKQQCEIVGICLTHMHNDFVGGHTSLKNITKAPIHTSKNSLYTGDHNALDDDAMVFVGDARVYCINIASHTDDMAAFVVKDQSGREFCIFVGDAFDAQYIEMSDEDLQKNKTLIATAMFNGIQKIMSFHEKTILFPTHMFDDWKSFTISQQRQSKIGWGGLPKHTFLQKIEQELLTAPQHRQLTKNININKFSPQNGSTSYIYNDDILKNTTYTIIDTRSLDEHKKYFLHHAIHIPLGIRFLHQLGQVIGYQEQWYCISQNRQISQSILERISLLGYDKNLLGIFLVEEGGDQKFFIDSTSIKQNIDAYIIVDVRSAKKVKRNKLFTKSLSIPLKVLRNVLHTIPSDKHILIYSDYEEDAFLAHSIIRNVCVNPHISLINDDVLYDLKIETTI